MYGIAADAVGNAYIAGVTSSRDFPLTRPLQASFGGASTQSFVAKVASTGSALVYSTLRGGSGSQSAMAVRVEPSGSATVTGSTTSCEIPLWDPISPALNGNIGAFVSRISPDGSSLEFSTYLGDPAAGFPAAITISGPIVVVGGTSYMTTSNTSLQAADLFFARVRFTQELRPGPESYYSLPYATAGSSYAVSTIVPAGTQQTTFAGTLPAGIVMDSAGNFSGIAASPGQYRFTLGLGDGDGTSGSLRLLLVVNPAGCIVKTQIPAPLPMVAGTGLAQVTASE